MIFKFLILSFLLHILLAIPIKPSGSQQRASNNPTQHLSSREQEEPLDLSTRNRNSDRNVPSTPGTANKRRRDPNAPSTSSGEKITCSLCDKPFNNLDSLYRHGKTIHRGKRYDCGKCDKKFTTSKNLRIHDVLEHDGDGKVHRCKICNYRTLDNVSMEEHKNRRRH